MPLYRIHRLREAERQRFRWAPHTSGITAVRPKDYQEDGGREAATPYDLWAALRGTPEALNPGDLLSTEAGDLRIYKYVGFEEARWALPEVRPEPLLEAPSNG